MLIVVMVFVVETIRISVMVSIGVFFFSRALFHEALVAVMARIMHNIKIALL